MIDEIILRYIQEYPYISNRKLAKLIVEKEKLQASPNTIRHHIGKLRAIEPQKNINLHSEITETIELPKSFYNTEPDYIIPSGVSKIAILSDIHIPFHDILALKTAIQYVENFQPDIIILNGDILDCYAISQFNRNPSFRDFNTEIQLGIQFFEYIRYKFPTTEIVYKLGNHEARLQHYLWRKAEELSNIEDIQIENLLKLKKFGVIYLSPIQKIKGQKFYIAHGHEIFASGGMVNIARNMRLKTFENIIVGHFHRTQEDIWTTIGGNAVGGWTIGCLCGLSAAYRPISFWNHGFAIIEIAENTFSVKNLKIINGMVK